MGEIKIDRDKCKGCRLCIEYCPQQSIELGTVLNKQGVLTARFNAVECPACAICAQVCPECCIEVYTENRGQKESDL